MHVYTEGPLFRALSWIHVVSAKGMCVRSTQKTMALYCQGGSPPFLCTYGRSLSLFGGGRAALLKEMESPFFILLLSLPIPLTSSLPLPPLSRSSDEEGGAIWRKNRPFRHEDKKAFPAVLCYSRKVTTQIESFTAAPSLKKQNFADWNCRVHDYGSARALLLSAPQTLPPSLQTPQRRILPSPLLSFSTPHAVAFG